MASQIDLGWAHTELIPFLRRVFAGRPGFPENHDYMRDLPHAEARINDIGEYDDSEITIERIRIGLIGLINPRDVMINAARQDDHVLQQVLRDTKLCIIIFVRHATTHGPYMLESLGEKPYGIIVESIRQLEAAGQPLPEIRYRPHPLPTFDPAKQGTANRELPILVDDVVKQARANGFYGRAVDINGFGLPSVSTRAPAPYDPFGDLVQFMRNGDGRPPKNSNVNNHQGHPGPGKGLQGAMDVGNHPARGAPKAHFSKGYKNAGAGGPPHHIDNGFKKKSKRLAHPNYYPQNDMANAGIQPHQPQWGVGQFYSVPQHLQQQGFTSWEGSAPTEVSRAGLGYHPYSSVFSPSAVGVVNVKSKAPSLRGDAPAFVPKSLRADAPEFVPGASAFGGNEYNRDTNKDNEMQAKLAKSLSEGAWAEN